MFAEIGPLSCFISHHVNIHIIHLLLKLTLLTNYSIILVHTS